MSVVITWATQQESDITHVRIYSSSSEGGTYTLVETVSATDGSGDWVTSYEHSAGTLSTWYKVVFYDGTSDSDFSNAMKGLERSLMCTVYDVKKHIDTVGRWTNQEIEEMIKMVEEDIYDEYGNPLMRALITTDEDYTKYFVGESDIYRIDRAYYGTATKTELTATTDFTTSRPMGIITLTTGGSITDVENNTNGLYVDYIPRIFSRLCAASVAQRLLEMTDVTSGITASKELVVIERKVIDIKDRILLRGSQTMAISSGKKGYDKTYGMNSVKVTQALQQNTWM